MRNTENLAPASRARKRVLRTLAIVAALAVAALALRLSEPSHHSTRPATQPTANPTPTVQRSTAPIAENITEFGCVTVEPMQLTGTSGNTSVMMVLDHALCLGKPTTGTVMWICTVNGQSVTGGDTFTATAARDGVTLSMDNGMPNARMWIAPPNFVLPADSMQPGACPVATDVTVTPGV